MRGNAAGNWSGVTRMKPCFSHARGRRALRWPRSILMRLRRYSTGWPGTTPQARDPHEAVAHPCAVPAVRIQRRKCAGDGLGAVRRAGPDADLSRQAPGQAVRAGAGNRDGGQGTVGREASDLGHQRHAADAHGVCAPGQEHRGSRRRDSRGRVPGTGHRSRRHGAVRLADLQRDHLRTSARISSAACIRARMRPTTKAAARTSPCRSIPGTWSAPMAR